MLNIFERTATPSAAPDHVAGWRGLIDRIGMRLGAFATVVVMAAVLSGAPLGAAWAQQVLANPNLPMSGIGRVEAMVVQGDGKIIIAGAFGYATSNGDARINIARLNADGTLDPTFDFRATSTVNALAIIGNTLYIGGDFTGLAKVGGATTLRNRLAAIDLTTLSITSWDPGADDEVYALAAGGTTLYAGGRFSYVNATQRIAGAAFDTSAGGALTAWDPEARDATAQFPVFQGIIYAIAPAGATIFIGGTFTQAGGLDQSLVKARANVAEVSATTGLVTTWDPVVSNGGGASIVRAIVPTASVVYLAGRFSALNNPAYTRIGIGSVSRTTGVVTAWNPGHLPPAGGGAFRALALDGTTMYAGGEFTGIGGAARGHVAGIDTATPDIIQLTQNGGVATAQVASTAALASNGFVTIAGATPTIYNGIKQITVADATHFTFPITVGTATPATGTITYAKNDNATAFNPDLDGDVHSMATTAANVLIGGNFVKAANVPNPAFGGFSKATGARTISGYVYDVAATWNLLRQTDGKTVVAGDFFLNSGGTFYRGLIRLNVDGTLDSGWNPGVDGPVTTASLGPVPDNTVLIGGTFNKVGATARRNIAAVSLSSGLATAFDANVNDTVEKIFVDGTTAYIGGRFTQLGGATRVFVGGVNATSGTAVSWYPTNGSMAGSGTDGSVNAIAVDAANVYIGGLFFTAGGQTRFNVAKVSKTTSAVDPTWNPGTDNQVFGLTVVGTTVYISGSFLHLAGQARAFTGAVDATTGTLTGWAPNPDFVVVKVTPAVSPANTLYLSGAFINVNGVQTGTAAAVDNVTGLLRPWTPLTNDTVYDLIPDASRVLMGGLFINVGAAPRAALAAVTIAGVPNPPIGIAASAGSAAATVTFVAPSNNGGSAVTGYTATCVPTAGAPASVSGPASPLTVTGLTNGVTYTCTVHATNSLGSSAESVASNPVTPTAPGTFSLNVAVLGSGSGGVSSTAPGIACPGDCSESYATGASVTLNAAPTGGSIFTGWLGGGCTGTAASCTVTIAAATTVTATFAPPGTLLSFDVDTSTSATKYEALSDGMLILRYLYGLTGNSLTNNAIGGTATLTTPTQLINHLNDIRPLFDVDGSGDVTAATDGLMILRYMFGLRGASLVQGAIAANGKRTDSAQIETYLAPRMP